jgi:hypothetical protein
LNVTNQGDPLNSAGNSNDPTNQFEEDDDDYQEDSPSMEFELRLEG